MLMEDYRKYFVTFLSVFCLVSGECLCCLRGQRVSGAHVVVRVIHPRRGCGNIKEARHRGRSCFVNIFVLQEKLENEVHHIRGLAR